MSLIGLLGSGFGQATGGGGIDPADVVSAEWVLVGHYNYTGGDPGTFDEAARNVDPGVSNVLVGTTYKIRGSGKVGTLDVAEDDGGSPGASPSGCGLDNRIASLNSIFLDPCRFGEEVTFIPRADWSQRSTVIAVVDRDSLPGTNEEPGDGRVLDKPSGRRVRDSIILYVPLAVDVRDIQPVDSPDCWRIDGAIWRTVRVMGSDSAGKDVLVVRQNVVLHRYTQR